MVKSGVTAQLHHRNEYAGKSREASSFFVFLLDLLAILGFVDSVNSVNNFN